MHLSLTGHVLTQISLMYTHTVTFTVLPNYANIVIWRAVAYSVSCLLSSHVTSSRLTAPGATVGTISLFVNLKKKQKTKQKTNQSPPPLSL